MRCYELWSSCLVDGNGERRTVGLDDLVGPFQPCDSMIPRGTATVLSHVPEGASW